MLTSREARRMRARRGGLGRARYWRAKGFPNLARATEARKRNAAARRALGLISPEWAKRLRRKGIVVGEAVVPAPSQPAPRAANDGAVLVESPPIRPMVVVDVGARGLTLSQFRSR